MNLKLYEVCPEIQKTMELIESYASEHDGEYPEWMDDRLNELNLNYGEKVANTGLLIKNIEAESEAIKAEENKLKQRRIVLENKANDLRRYLAAFLDKPVNDPRISVRFNNKDYVQLLVKDVDVPEEFKDKKETYSVSKTKIREFIEAENECNFAKLSHKVQIK